MQNNNTPEITVDYILGEPEGYDKFVFSLFNRSEDESKNFAHAVLGVVTECDELLAAADHTNAIEEFGDLGFYVVAAMQVARRVLGLTSEQLSQELAETIDLAEAELIGMSPQRLIVEMRTRIEDHAKRWVGYGKQPPLLQALVEVCTLASCAVGSSLLAPSGGQACADVATRANVAKLLERYKGVTFSAEAAINRDTTAERAVLEKHAA